MWVGKHASKAERQQVCGACTSLTKDKFKHWIVGSCSCVGCSYVRTRAFSGWEVDNSNPELRGLELSLFISKNINWKWPWDVRDGKCTGFVFVCFACRPSRWLRSGWRRASWIASHPCPKWSKVPVCFGWENTYFTLTVLWLAISFCNALQRHTYTPAQVSCCLCCSIACS